MASLRQPGGDPGPLPRRPLPARSLWVGAAVGPGGRESPSPPGSRRPPRGSLRRSRRPAPFPGPVPLCAPRGDAAEPRLEGASARLCFCGGKALRLLPRPIRIRVRLMFGLVVVFWVFLGGRGGCSPFFFFPPFFFFFPRTPSSLFLFFFNGKSVLRGQGKFTFFFLFSLLPVRRFGCMRFSSPRCSFFIYSGSTAK